MNEEERQQLILDVKKAEKIEKQCVRLYGEVQCLPLPKGTIFRGKTVDTGLRWRMQKSSSEFESNQ